MERKTFLATAAGAAAILGTLGASPAPMPAPAKPDAGSDRNLRFMRQIINAVIDDLNTDARDYGGHRVQAIDSLHQAVNHLDAALQFDQTQ